MQRTQMDHPAGNFEHASSTTFLDGGGELGGLMRAFDWAATPLGPPAAWPRSLKTAVRIMLTSRQPFWLGWGPELTYLYNDAYKSIIGGKHPWALGRPFREVWSEIWDVVGPLADEAMQGDEGTYVEAQLLIMERHGYQEETYYTYSYSAVPGDDGEPAGLICANTDDTRRVIGERQVETMRELAAKTANARNLQDACKLATEALATNARDLPFALIYLGEGHGKRPELAAASPGTAALVDDALWPWAAVMAEQQTRIVPLANLDPAVVPKGAWPRPPEYAAVLPIAPSGNSGRAGVLVVGLNPFRRYDDTYRGFLDLVAGQLAASITNAEAYEQEKKRAEALAELDRAKTAFFSNVSHEFRTPLTLMLGPVDELLLNHAEDSSPEARVLLGMMQRNGQRLLKLVNTLLDFARVEAGRAQTSFEATDLPAFTAELASNFRAACGRAGLRLDIDCPPLPEPAWIDRDMWEKVVLNLISNAFKYTLRGEIAVAVRKTPAGFELAVRDTGTGVPAHALPHLFERFYRVEGAHGRSHEGSGIGLALVHELVKLHGGTISVTSTVGVGTEFTVAIPGGKTHLPAARLKAPRADALALRADAYVAEALSWLPESAAPAPLAAPNGARVLLADDNADLREYARRLLAGSYDVEAVGDGEAALAAARARRPDVIVSDVMMPKLDGLGLVRELRADPALGTVPVILLSARAGDEARLEGLASGADDYLTKPFSARELLVRVGALLQSAQVRRKAHEEVERNAARFEALLNGAPLGVYLVDDHFRVAAVNPVATPVFGDIPGLIGRDFDEVIRVLWPKRYADELVLRFRHTLATGEPYVEQERAERRADSGIVEYYAWRINRIPLEEGRFGVVCYFRDVSRSVMDREALRDSDRRKDEFLATLSHELRNPLAPLRNALHVLRKARESDPTTVARFYDMMERQVNHLVHLVDDLLEMSRISRGALELKSEPVEIAAAVRNAVETSEPLMQAAGHRLTVTLPPEKLVVQGDAVRLAQILANILNNAAKYTDAGGSIRVDVRREGDTVAIAIADNGPGIGPDALPRIFEMFNRGEQGRRHDGLGIGLSLSRRLAEMHGGTLDAASAGPGHGSEFTVRLPLARAPERPALSAAPLPSDTAPRRLLVVDDHVDAADSLAVLLKLLGAEVNVARDGFEALSALESIDPDAILLDIGMPGMDGYETARRIRARYPERRAALIALTGWGQEQDRQRARDAGFDHHVVKPADIAALRSILAALPAGSEPSVVEG